MKFFITGITGFAAPHLVKLLLRDNHEVFAMIRHSNGRQTDLLDVLTISELDKVVFLQADLRDRISVEKIFKENQFDGVFHLAAQSHPPTSFTDPIGTWEINVLGSMYLITAIENYQNNCKLMFCSTSEVYGNEGSDGRKLDPYKDNIKPSNPYGASKAAIDLYLQERFSKGFINGFITRAFSHTGPRRGNNFSISCDAYQLIKFEKEFLSRFCSTQPEFKLLVGNLETTRVVMDVRDTVDAYYKLMMSEKSNGNVFNVCGNIPHKMEYFTDILIDNTKIPNKLIKKIVYEKFYRPIDIFYQHGNSDDLKSLGWKESFSNEDTMIDLLNYWRKKIE